MTTTTTAPTVSTRGLDKVYGSEPAEVHALRGVDLGIDPGKFTAIMGPSGSGKSSLLHCLAGLDRPTSGSISLDGTELTGLSEKQLTDLRRDRIGFVFQQYNLLSELTGADNIVLPLEIAGRRPDQQWLDTVVDALAIRAHLKRRPAELSGGQQQRIGIARALVTRPAVVFADEPTGNLDSATSRDVLGFLQRSTREFGQTVVMVTHDPGAAAHADRVVLLADGRIAGDLREPSSTEILHALDTLSG